MTSRKLMMTQTTADSATCRLRWISGRARTTMVVSIAVIRTPDMITIMARPVRGDRLTWASAPAACECGRWMRGNVTFLA